MTLKAFTAIIHREGNIFVADCLKVGTGTFSQRYLVDQAIANLATATELHLEEFPLSD